ncbi:hypothetical protein, partial [Microbacterium sp. CPCC 204701]|uniref:hypothetical protein n=1 Tax=Microbacterium sp. CPCC 204701 TaxID=2493084 RepID=UPI00197B136C
MREEAERRAREAATEQAELGAFDLPSDDFAPVAVPVAPLRALPPDLVIASGRSDSNSSRAAQAVSARLARSPTGTSPVRPVSSARRAAR